MAIFVRPALWHIKGVFIVLLVLVLSFFLLFMTNSNITLAYLKIEEKSLTIIDKKLNEDRYLRGNKRTITSLETAAPTKQFVSFHSQKEFESTNTEGENNLTVKDEIDSEIKTSPYVSVLRTAENENINESITTPHATTTNQATATNEQLTTETLTTVHPDESSLVTNPLTNDAYDLTKLLTTDTSNKKCTPIENVIFLKTHKTGSSTLINIFQRYGENHNLSIALPGTSHFLGWPNTFKKEFISEYEQNKTYNIICNHARFHKKRMLEVMKSNNTKIVTIVRDPLYQFESTSVYLHFEKLFKLNTSKNIVEAFFNQSEEHIRTTIFNSNTQSKYLAKNPNMYDMGFPTWDKKPTLEYTMDKVKRDFDLVMISDYMAESLVLLKDLLCWDMKDIVYFTMNKRPNKYRQKITNVQQARMRVSKWNEVDSEIFNHFNKTLWQKIQSKGDSFHKDLQMLKSMNKKLEDTCLDKGKHFDKSQPWFPILGFKLKNSTKNLPYKQLCEDMIRPEIYYNNILKRKYSTKDWTGRPELKRRRKIIKHGTA